MLPEIKALWMRTTMHVKTCVNSAAVVIALGAFGAIAASPAHAALVEVDLSTSGDGMLVWDDVNNREWVDLTQTANMSVNSALSIYQPLGFRLATSADVFQLFVAAGIPDIQVGSPTSGVSTSGTVANRAPVENLLALMNHTAPYTAMGGNAWIHGYTDYGSSTTLSLSRFAAFNSDNVGRAQVNSNGFSWTYDRVHSAIGTYLVRDAAPAPVPLPAALPLMLVAMGGFAVVSRRRKTA